MPKFKIPVRWEMYGVVEVEASDIDDATDIAANDIKLSDINAEYLDGSFQVDYEMLECYNPKLEELCNG